MFATAILTIDATSFSVCLFARNILTGEGWIFMALRPDSCARVKLPAWLDEALTLRTCRIEYEGGKDGQAWREFQAWCLESNKPHDQVTLGPGKPDNPTAR